MPVLTRRHARAALAGAVAAATYLAAAEISSRKPVKGGALFLLTTAALAGMAVQATRNSASDKAYAVEQRLNNFFANGGMVGGDLYVTGVTHMTGGGSMGATLHFNQNNIDGLTQINEDGTAAGFHGAVFMNDKDLWMQGGTIHANSGNL